MKQVVPLYTELVENGRVNAIRRYNLRKLFRDLNLPPCGVSFWELEDLNWDYLQSLNTALRHERFVFRGGDDFPRAFLDDRVLGLDRRGEFIYLIHGKGQQAALLSFFSRQFSEHERIFGRSWPLGQQTRGLEAAARFRHALTEDLIHFADQGDFLNTVADLYLCLTLLAFLPQPCDHTRDGILDAFRTAFPVFNSEVVRIKTTVDRDERLEDILNLMARLDAAIQQIPRQGS